MPRPKKNAGAQQAPPPVRRSSRIAASSRASSVATEENDEVASPTVSIIKEEEEEIQEEDEDEQEQEPTHSRKSLSPASLEEVAQPANFEDLPFDPLREALEIVMSQQGRKRIHKLTLTQCQGVITALADRENDMRSRVDDLEEKNGQHEEIIERLKEELKTEKEQRTAKLSLRDDAFLRRYRLEEARRQGVKNPTFTSTDPFRETSTPAPEQTNTPEDTAQTQTERPSTPIENKEQPLAPSTPQPEAAAETHMQLARAQTEVQKPKSWFNRIFSVVSLPFSPVRPNQTLAPTPAPAEPEAPQQPLGDLTGSRKRTFTEAVPEAAQQTREPEKPARETTSTPKRANPLHSHPTLPKSTRRRPDNPLATPLATISERSENTTSHPTTGLEATPARPYRSVTKMRREQAERERLARMTPRAWTPKTVPREPNADARLEKLREYERKKQELQALREDDDIREMVGRPVKRVKIEDLVQIPHNRPGESSGTFRMYDEVSDGEMEVDEDEPVRQNIFEKSQRDSTTTTNNAIEAATAPIEQQPLQVESDPEIEQMVLNFPSVGRRPEYLRDQPIDDVAVAKFRWGLASFQRNGEIITW